jgi:hypothetical protein
MEITEIKLLVESELGLGYRSQLVGVDDQAIVHGLPLLLRVVGILLVLFCQIGRQLVAGQSLGYLVALGQVGLELLSYGLLSRVNVLVDQVRLLAS